MRIAFATLGCKINQYESDLLCQDLQARGNSIVPFEADADVYIINTCSVTAKSDSQCRKIIRSAVKRGGGASVVVTGCYAETRPDELRAIPGVKLIVGNRDKSSLATRISQEQAEATVSAAHDPIAHQTTRRKTRGFLKIQDGCDNRCSYCIVPLARGGSRSVPSEEVMKEFENLVRAGFPEIVLTGIHIGTYGLDLPNRTDLTSLLAKMFAIRGPARIRLSSIEPNEITAEIINYLGQGLCRHLHIPLQSGDDTILSNMGRKYTSAYYRGLLSNIASQVPGVALGADIMVGFPGEGERAFQNTLSLVAETPLTHVHVFSYSPRPGTPASQMNNQVSEATKKERSETLRELGRKKNTDFRMKCKGSVYQVIVEAKKDARTGFLMGLTDNYIRVAVSGAQSSQIGTETRVMLEKVEETENIAVIL